MDTQKPYSTERPLTVRGWIVTLLLMYLPPVNLIFLFYWAFGANIDPNRKNFSRAALIVIAALTAVAVLMFFYMLVCIDPNERIKAFLMVE